MFKKLFYFAGWACRNYLFNRKIPVIGGLVITDRCNLNCMHCAVSNLGGGDLSIEEVRQSLEILYRNGARLLYIQGGEAFAWRDGECNLEDVVELARRMGFFRINIYTNGNYSLNSGADILWVSIDGLKDTHDKIRGKSFELVMQNIENSSHCKIIINFTANALNYSETGELIRLVGEHDKIKGIFINFHIPYPGTEELFLPLEKRGIVIDLALSMKKKSYPVFNSRAGLLAMKKNDWQRPIWLCGLMDKGKYYHCCRALGDEDLCRVCGYSAMAEVSITYRGSLPAAVASLRYI